MEIAKAFLEVAKLGGRELGVGKVFCDVKGGKGRREREGGEGGRGRRRKGEEGCWKEEGRAGGQRRKGWGWGGVA